jgi:hypothetical protein
MRSRHVVGLLLLMLLGAGCATVEGPTTDEVQPTNGLLGQETEAVPTAAPENLAEPTATEAAVTGGEVMQLTSPAFEAGGTIPVKFSCDGEDISPPLSWQQVPEAVKGFALVMDDPDAPAGTWDHWLLYNIPASVRSLPEAVPATPKLEDGSSHGSNSWGRLDYGGPCPPSGTHRYQFRLYALDAELNLESGLSKSALESAIAGHILDQVELLGKYSR